MNIFITGEHGYIAGRLKQALSGEGRRCDAISLRSGPEGFPDLSAYDTVIHCAALVHSKENNPERFFRVNTDLTAALAEKSKRAGVKRFVFLSTMAVYGVSDSMRGLTVIDSRTPENPQTPYGRSKLAAENKLRAMACDGFNVYILRLPMVYGAGAPGNYARLCRLVKLTPVFPKVSNKRSMIGIENLQNFVVNLLKYAEAGEAETDAAEYARILCPQDPEPVCTSDMAAGIAAAYGKKLILSDFLGRLILLFPVGPVRKMFGSMVYAEKQYSSPSRR